jgi:hypothetical protein
VPNFTLGSDNIFRDLGLSDADELMDEAEHLLRKGGVVPGIYPIEPIITQPRDCACSKPMLLYIPPGHYYQCSCGNRLHGSHANC